MEIDAGGLASALAHLAENITARYRVPCFFSSKEHVAVSDQRVATQVYRIAQEAAANAATHAKARKIEIVLRSRGDLLTLEVVDDGVGFSGLPKPGKGLGLRIMRDGAALIAATLTIEAGKPTGTRIICTVPSTTASRPKGARKGSSLRRSAPGGFTP